MKHGHMSGGKCEKEIDPPKGIFPFRLIRGCVTQGFYRGQKIEYIWPPLAINHQTNTPFANYTRTAGSLNTLLLVVFMMMFSVGAVRADDSLTNLLIAHYPLEQDGRDVLNNNPAADLLRVEFGRQGLFLNGQYEFDGSIVNGTPAGFRSVFQAESLSYFSLSFSVDLLPLDFKVKPPSPFANFENSCRASLNFPLRFGDFDHRSVIVLGEGYRWLAVKQRSGQLEIDLNNGDFRRTLPGVCLAPGHWHRLIVSFDFNARSILVSVDGEIQPAIALPNDLQLEVVLNPPDKNEKTVIFTDYSVGAAYHGYARDLRIFSRALSAAEIKTVAADRAWLNRPEVTTPRAWLFIISSSILAGGFLVWLFLRMRPAKQSGF